VRQDLPRKLALTERRGIDHLPTVGCAAVGVGRWDMADGWLAVIALVLLVLAAANAAIFLLAWYEWANSPKKDPWLRSTQILAPTNGAPRSTAILLHGFGGTPCDFRPMAEALAGQGFRVVVPDLPGQTSTSFAYGRGSYTAAFYRDWLKALIAEETALAGKPPALVGTSMGGTLAAIGAADFKVSRAVLIAPYFSLAVGGEWTTRLTALLRWVLPVMPKLQKGQINDPVGYKEYQTGSYLVSLPAFMHLAELARIARDKMSALAVPTLVFAGPKDAVASFATTERLCTGCRDVRLVACDRSNHVLTYDYDRERITSETLAFLGAEAPRAGP
jgi:carboxylesterase